jgi:hypothetical protein
VEHGRLADTLEFPGGGVGIVFVVACGLAFRGLILFAEVAAAAFVAVERVAADEFGEFEVIDDRARLPTDRTG